MQLVSGLIAPYYSTFRTFTEGAFMAVLVQQSVKRTLYGMAFPMLAGTFAMNAYNLTDTYFVSRLGTLPLAAMGFSFPVVMLLTCMAGGLGTGVTTLVSHAIGRHDHDEAARITTHGILLVLGLTTVLSAAGYLSIGVVFPRLGADAQTLPLIGEYMRTWYVGAIFMSLPMLGNGILISSGDSRSASRFMVLGTMLNLALDPIMIFGYFGFPAMGIRGAALATVIAQAVATAWLLYLLRRKHRLLVFRRWRFGDYLDSYRRILQMGVPAVLSMVLMPISAGVITALLGRFGNEAVAACGAAGRIEMFAFVIPMALGISLMPFVSQNLGANRLDRIRETITVSTRFAMLYGVGVAILFCLCAPVLASVFSDDPKVTGVLVSYIRIISFGYGMMEVHRYSGIMLAGLHKPLSATALNSIRVLVFLIPLTCLGAYLYGVRGIFFGRLVTDLIAGSLGLIWVRRTCEAMQAAAHADRSSLQQDGTAVLPVEA
jgi:putative MATE family efflux protein